MEEAPAIGRCGLPVSSRAQTTSRLNCRLNTAMMKRNGPATEATYLGREALTRATTRGPSHTSMSRPSCIALAFAMISASESHSIITDGPAIW
jgi:hypothetical protein